MAYWKLDVFEEIANQSERSRQKPEGSIFRCPPQFSVSRPQCFTPAVLTVGPYSSNDASKDAREYQQLNKYKVKVATEVLKRKNLELEAGLETLVKAILASDLLDLTEYAAHFDQDICDVHKILAIDSLFVAGLLLTFVSWCKPRFFESMSLSSRPSVMQIINNFPGFEVKEDPVLLVQNAVFFQDLFLLENQVPLSFLKRALMFVVGDQLTEDLAGDLLITIATCAVRVVSFFTLAEDLLSEIVDQIKSSMSSCPHLLDFFYKVTTYCMLLNDPEGRSSLDFHVPSISKLRASGIQLAATEGSAVYARYEWEQSRIVLPTIAITGHTEHLVRNLLAYEVLTVSKPVLSTYALLMDKLVNTPDDVRIMQKHGVITGEVGEQEVCDLWKSAVLHMELDILSSRKEELQLLTRRERNKLMRAIADLKNRVSSVYLTLTLLAAGILLICTILQTGYTIAGFYQV